MVTRWVVIPCEHFLTASRVRECATLSSLLRRWIAGALACAVALSVGGRGSPVLCTDVWSVLSPQWRVGTSGSFALARFDARPLLSEDVLFEWTFVLHHGVSVRGQSACRSMYAGSVSPGRLHTYRMPLYSIVAYDVRSTGASRGS